MSDVKWTNAQEMAITLKGSDLIISAAAGSGKSATLTERIIRKIKTGSDISRMLIVTFTKAATGELKNKISTSLGKALSEFPDNSHIQEQIIKVGSADICTIDSFCMRLVRPNFDKLMLDADFRIGDQGEIEILENEVMTELIDELYESDAKNEDFLLVVDCYSSLWSENELVSALLKLRNKLLSTADGLETLIKNNNTTSDFLSSSYGEVFKKHLNEALNYYIPVYTSAVKDISSDKKGDKYIDLFSRELGYLERLKNALTNNLGYDKLVEIGNDMFFERISTAKLDNDKIPLGLYKSVRKNAKEFFEGFIKRFLQSSEEAIASTTKQNFVICNAIYNILKRFENALLRRKRQFSVYSFNDISNFAISLLYDENGNVTQFAKEIASKYDEIYIDEYQDTNSTQDKIFRAISKNNRFMVGDIKQSIYRFRSAEPEIFSYYRTHFDKKDAFDESSPGLSIFMSNNFRCDKKIVDFSNLVSNHIFESSYGIPYERSDELIYSKKQADDYKSKDVEVCLIDSEGLGRGNNVKYEAEYIAKRIKRMIDCEYLPNGEKIRPSHIAILLRNYKSPSKIYIEALEKYGISSRYDVTEDFFSKPHIMLFISILNAIDNPSRDIHLAGAMRSEIFSFTLDELVRIRMHAEKTASLYSCILRYNKDSDLRARLDEFLNRLNEYKKAIRKMTSYEAIAYIFGHCGILSMCDNEQRSDFIALYNLAREYEASSYKGLYSFLKHIEKLANGDGEKSVRGDTAKENVRIMTIHSSKGLEFEICFICDINSPFNHSDSTSNILFQRQLGIAGYVGKHDGLTRFETMARKCIALQLERDMREEEMRVLYVAMTRARNQLILVGSLSKPKSVIDLARDGKMYDSPYLMYSSSSLFKLILGAICEPNDCFQINYLDAGDNAPSDTLKSEPIISRELVDGYKKILNKRFSFKYKYDYLDLLPSKMSISKLYPEILDDTDNGDIVISPLKSVPKFLDTAEEAVMANERGTATHVFLQFCNFESLIKNGVDYEIERLVNGSFISKRDSEIVNTQHLEAFLKSSLLKEILKAKRVIREFRFNVMLDASEFSRNDKVQNEKVLVQGVTDCIYENEMGELILVDYKTDSVTLENYESLLTERHKTQLTYYKKACELMFEKPIAKVLIYSVPLAKIVEIK